MAIRKCFFHSQTFKCTIVLFFLWSCKESIVISLLYLFGLLHYSVFSLLAQCFVEKILNLVPRVWSLHPLLTLVVPFLNVEGLGNP